MLEAGGEGEGGKAAMQVAVVVQPIVLTSGISVTVPVMTAAVVMTRAAH